MKKVFVLAVLFMIHSYVSALAADDTVLAKIGDEKITISNFKRMINYFDAGTRKMIEQDPQFKAVVLQNIVQRMVISKMARDKGLDKRPHIKEQIELYSIDLLTSEYLKEEVIAKIDVTEDDIKSYYKAHQEEFEAPEMIRVRHILIRNPMSKSDSIDDKNKRKEKAEEVLKKIKAGEDFAGLASESSEDQASKEKGGDLGLITKGMMVPELEKVAFSLRPGEVSDIIETRYGFHIIKVEEKRESFIEPYEKIKDKVKEKLFNDLKKTGVEEFIRKVEKDAGVEIYPELLSDKEKK